MEIVVIGSGNVATHFAHALQNVGNNIIQIYSRNLASAQLLANQVDAEAVNAFADITDDADLYVLAIPDDALYDVVTQIPPKKGICVHTSGAVPMDVLKPLSQRIGVLYSPQTFVKYLEMNYSELPFCLEANSDEELQHLKDLVSPVSTKIYEINSDQRRKLHLAAVFVNNFVNAMNATAQEILAVDGIPFEILYPLISGTAQKATLGDLWQLQTGPAVRGDSNTIANHRRMLAADADLYEVYTLITSLIEKKCRHS
ncbi:MAG: DUF2520 domain-containing protein [Bacteroidales bacterium]|nr:DUF2520 domain-containing protein [Bacteroidales bacterium]MBR5029177.1 DUF2520 domain-containing protein [Bacteroidales bacterium]